jgi:hypothetical protein
MDEHDIGENILDLVPLVCGDCDPAAAVEIIV